MHPRISGSSLPLSSRWTGYSFKVRVIDSPEYGLHTTSILALLSTGFVILLKPKHLLHKEHKSLTQQLVFSSIFRSCSWHSSHPPAFSPLACWGEMCCIALHSFSSSATTGTSTATLGKRPQATTWVIYSCSLLGTDTCWAFIILTRFTTWMNIRRWHQRSQQLKKCYPKRGKRKE